MWQIMAEATLGFNWGIHLCGGGFQPR